MSGTTEAAPSEPPASRSVRLRGREYLVVPPNVRDPRLHLAGVIISLQVLGQTTLHFDLSIAQIVVAVLTSALLEVAITLRRTGVVLWPGSALLTGNSVAFILRVPGTEHGDWWSTRGWWVFAAVSAVSLLSKYVIRHQGRHVFNPSNLGLVVAFLALGSTRADPQDLWWGDVSVGLALTLAVIVIGGVVIVSRLQMLALVLAFWSTLALAAGLVAARGHCMTARWHAGAVCGRSFWWVLLTSPEILVFTFFMITDPKTAPRGRVARVVYGAAVGLIAALLLAPARSEFATKVGVLAALVVTCAVVPLLVRWLPPVGSPADRPWPWIAALALKNPTRRLAAAGAVALTALALVGSGARSASSPEIFSIADPATSSTSIPGVIAPGLPPVTIDPGVSDAFPEITAAVADSMVRDVLTDLVTAARAIELQDSRLARRAGAEPWIEGVLAQMETSAEGGHVVTTDYRFSDATVVLARRDPAQASPEPAVEVRGEVIETVRSESDGRVVRTTTTPFDRVLLVFRVDGRGPYLINDEAEPEKRSGGGE